MRGYEAFSFFILISFQSAIPRPLNFEHTYFFSTPLLHTIDTQQQLRVPAAAAAAAALCAASYSTRTHANLLCCVLVVGRGHL